MVPYFCPDARCLHLGMMSPSREGEWQANRKIAKGQGLCYHIDHGGSMWVDLLLGSQLRLHCFLMHDIQIRGVPSFVVLQDKFN
jgi:hypothetical protein